MRLQLLPRAEKPLSRLTATGGRLVLSVLLTGLALDVRPATASDAPETRDQGLRAPGHEPAGRLDDGGGSVQVEKPSPTLADQLDLPKGQGLAVRVLRADSPAARAGLKAHDILLELDGKPVPDDVHEFARMVRDLKGKTAVEALVLRKGRRETIKGLSLPEPRPEGPFVPLIVDAPPVALPAPLMPVPAAFPAPLLPVPVNLANPENTAIAPLIPGRPNLAGAERAVLTRTRRIEDRFTTRYDEGSLTITVSGTTAGGKVKVGEVTVQDDLESHSYGSLEKLPKQFQGKLKPAQLDGPFADDGGMTTVLRLDDCFTLGYEGGDVTITMKGKVAGGKTKVAEVRVQDGEQSWKVESVDQLPGKYQDKANKLLTPRE